MNIDQQIAWLDSVVDVFVLDCEPKQNLAEVRNTLERLRDVLEAAEGLRWDDRGLIVGGMDELIVACKAARGE